MTANEGRRTTSVATAPEASRPVAILPTVDDIREHLAAFDSGRAVGELEGFRRGHITGYDLGHADGYELAMVEVQAAEDAWIDAVNRGSVELVLRRGDFASLSDLRGMPERAERQRRLLAERGVTA